MMKQGQLKVPPYQRNYVWDEVQQALFIDSIIKGHYVGQMLLVKSEKPNCLDIVDGHQRLKTIYNFIENGFQVKNTKQGLGGITQEEFLNRPLQIYIIEKLLDCDQNTEIFRLINNTGEPLKKQELRRTNTKGVFAKFVNTLVIELYPQKESLRLNDDNSELIFSSNIWHRLGVLTKKELLQREDEALLAKIILSILYNKHQPPKDDLLDAAYDEKNPEFSEINNKLSNYPSSKLVLNLKSIFTLLNEITLNVECFSKKGFYITFLALYDIIINDRKQIGHPNTLVETFNDINSLVLPQQTTNIQYEKLMKYAKYLIIQNCCENDTSRKINLLKNTLEDSKIETAKYEFKQGFLRLSDDRKKDKYLKNQILETICGMANAAFMEPAYLFIGIADKESDAQRIAFLDNITPLNLAEHYIVGIEREAKIMNISVDEYCAQIKDFIDKSDLSRSLQLSVLSNMDIITYQGFSVVCIVIPPQKELSYLGESIFIRKHSSTTEVKKPREIIALFNNFYRNQ